jgi:ketosteroid isomerase-like protein
MTPKDVVAKNYECFNTGDMETFVSLYHEDVVVTVNGMHRFSGVHKGINAFLEVLGGLPSRFENFSVTPTNMIAEGDQVFTQIHAKAEGLDANFGHFHRLVDGKIKEFWIYDDSQKMAHVMKAV